MCNFNPRTFAQAEMGCPLDHAACGAHIVDGDEHEETCKECKKLQANFELTHIDIEEIEF